MVNNDFSQLPKYTEFVESPFSSLVKNSKVEKARCRKLFLMEKYTLIKRIGSGSYGTAYLGKEKASGVLFCCRFE